MATGAREAPIRVLAASDPGVAEPCAAPRAAGRVAGRASGPVVSCGRLVATGAVRRGRVPEAPTADAVAIRARACAMAPRAIVALSARRPRTGVVERPAAHAVAPGARPRFVLGRAGVTRGARRTLARVFERPRDARLLVAVDTCSGDGGVGRALGVAGLTIGPVPGMHEHERGSRRVAGHAFATWVMGRLVARRAHRRRHDVAAGTGDGHVPV